jgi:hypothetical protein
LKAVEPLTAIPTLAIASIYCLYDAHRREIEHQKKRRQVLRERVARMLWVMVEQIEGEEKTWHTEA